MVSTYLSYDLVNRDLSTSLKRVSNQSAVKREADYYEANIGKITSVDEFMDDYRLYAYAMKAYGLEDMTYAKAFMQKILESDLSDDDSFANKLADSRYRDFATAFNFSVQGAAAQSETQIGNFTDLYGTTMDDKGAGVATETGYFNAMMSQVGSADALLNNERLRSYVFTAFGVDEKYYNRAVVKGVLSSDTTDPDSYINTTLGVQRDDLGNRLTDAQARFEAATTTADKNLIQAEINGYESSLDTIQTYYDMANAFNFNADGTMPAEGAQSAEQQTAVNTLYLANQERLSSATAAAERDYVNAKMATVTDVNEILTDNRVYNYIKVAFDLTSATVVRSTIEQILTSDLNDPGSYANIYGATRPAYLDLAKAFNFGTDGKVAAGAAQTTQQAAEAASRYFSRYDDAQDAADEKAVSLYKTAIADVKTVDEFLTKPDVFNFALKAVGLDPASVSKSTIKQVLTSDLTDSKSYAYKLNDERYLTLARAFNFTKDGGITTALSAQTEGTVKSVASEYIIKVTRFIDDEKRLGTKETENESGKKVRENITARTKAKEEASVETKYYSEQMLKIKTASEFIDDDRLTTVLLTAYDIDPKSVDKDFLKQVFASDLSDPESFVNQQKNSVWAEILGTFNFDTKGNLAKRDDGTSIQTQGKVLETENRYNRQTLEEEQGESNNGVRLALYFERMSKSITSAYDIIGDTALLEFFRTTYSLPEEFSNMDVDKQAELVKKYMNLEDLKDPEKVQKVINKFTALYDLENSNASSSALSILTGNMSGAGISADLLSAISQYR
ncbi:DUF1217 domain-containing protein [Rhizobiales bacterium RZME27]|uniref:DUF1217 domain-containing protein n=1 Tax=Endobacterium cereale TaxID=2663029 RepID=A0A6A8AEJ5_9HYPH|nr:DUF1217 domain-containing protein [Endobacterium cereale]MEB2846946.1 DUF1217 domain-containing protein [Endobacterium cereale]MQY47636.1 DUF1217 domain-containing protein [Endobacterium cereale]